jgi:hypothetical protein
MLYLAAHEFEQYREKQDLRFEKLRTRDKLVEVKETAENSTAAPSTGAAGSDATLDDSKKRKKISDPEADKLKKQKAREEQRQAETDNFINT